MLEIRNTLPRHPVPDAGSRATIARLRSIALGPASRAGRRPVGGPALMTAAKSFRIADSLLMIVGLIAVAYHMVLVHWQIQDSTYHYITHVFLVMTIASLAAIADALKDFGGWRSKVKLVLSFVALAANAYSMAYLRVNAIELEMSQPFHPKCRTCGPSGWRSSRSTILTWIHWGGIIASFTMIFVAYFFWGHLISGPMGIRSMSTISFSPIWAPA